MPKKQPRRPARPKRRDVLTSMQRRAYDMHRAGWRMKWIAAQFGVTPSAISQRLKRARERLAKAAGPRPTLFAPGAGQWMPTTTGVGVWTE